MISKLYQVAKKYEKVGNNEYNTLNFFKNKYSESDICAQLHCEVTGLWSVIQITGEQSQGHLWATAL